MKGIHDNRGAVLLVGKAARRPEGNGSENESLGRDGQHQLWDGLLELFPDARFIFLTRGFDRTLASVLAKQEWFVSFPVNET